MGITKNRWNIVTVEDVIDVRDGTHDSPKFIESGIPLVTSKNLRNGSIDFSSCSFISMEDHEKISKRSSVDVGDILLAMIGTIGNPVIVEENIDFSIKNVALFKFKNSSVFNRYFYYLLNSSLIENQLSENSRGGTQKFVSLGNLRKLKIPLPPLEEQKRIAAILDKADAIRQKRQKAIELADEFLRSVFLDMFGDPVTNPKGWKLESLKTLSSKIGSGSTPRGGSEVYKTVGISLIRSLNIHDDDFRFKDLAYIDEEQADQLANVIVEKGDILLNITGASVCRTAIVPESVLPARVNQHVCIIRPIKIKSEYLLHLFISTSYKNKLLKMSGAGATREALTKQQIELLEIPVPPKELQEKYVLLKKLVEKMKLSFYSSEKLPLFEALSQNAFSGKL